MFKKISDKKIIEGLRKQDDNILTWIYDNYRQQVRHYVLKNSGSEADASDVLQESVIILYTRITEDNIQLTTDLKGYFFGISRNIWSAQLRKKLKNADMVYDFPDEPEYEDLKNVALEKIISRAFQKLKPDSQTILRLYSDGCSFQEIALRMNLKNETYARRKKYLSKEALIRLIKKDPEYQNYWSFWE